MILPTRRSLDQEFIDEIVVRTVNAVSPEKIILFGSAARGEMGPHSDVDLLVVKAGSYNRRAAAVQVRRSLRGLKEAFDIVVTTPEDLERYGDSYGLIYRVAIERNS